MAPYAARVRLGLGESAALPDDRIDQPREVRIRDARSDSLEQAEPEARKCRPAKKLCTIIWRQQIEYPCPDQPDKAFR